METRSSEGAHKPHIIIIASAAGVLLVGALAWTAGQQQPKQSAEGYPLHQDIATTVFWVGESANESNRFIHNRSSTWIEDWQRAFGGVDDPNERCGWQPCTFTPKENPFYFALPYSDLDESCDAKPSQQRIPWANDNMAPGMSAVKNQWIEIHSGNKTAYAQWQDAGPYGEDDVDYVFGDNEPAAQVGLDVSPATADYLNLDGHDQTAWRFIPADEVPDGPWKQTITTSAPDCAA